MQAAEPRRQRGESAAEGRRFCRLPRRWTRDELPAPNLDGTSRFGGAEAQRLILTLFCVWVLAALAQAQEWLPKFRREWNTGIEHHSAGRYDEAIASFERCLRISPDNASCAYNIACGHALQQRLDQAFEWLAKAGDWGFAYSDGNLELARGDPDLERLRADPRFEELMGRMQSLLAEAQAYSSEAGVYIPPRLAEAEKIPLLVVLHDFGETRETALVEWTPIAEQLGTALVVPSARFPVGAEPSKGMSWFDDLEQYRQRFVDYETTINRAVKAFSRQHALDRQRVTIAGTGQGGMVAFNVAVHGSGFYRGVLVLNGPLHEELAQPKFAQAAESGLKVRVLVLGDALWGLSELDLGAWCEELRGRLTEEWKLADSSVRYHDGKPCDAAATRAAIVEALESL